MNEDDFLSDIAGFEKTNNGAERNVEKVKRGSAIRWIVPPILLVLALLFVAGSAPSSVLTGQHWLKPGASGKTDRHRLRTSRAAGAQIKRGPDRGPRGRSL